MCVEVTGERHKEGGSPPPIRVQAVKTGLSVAPYSRQEAYSLDSMSRLRQPSVRRQCRRRRRRSCTWANTRSTGLSSAPLPPFPLPSPVRLKGLAHAFHDDVGAVGPEPLGVGRDLLVEGGREADRHGEAPSLLRLDLHLLLPPYLLPERAQGTDAEEGPLLRISILPGDWAAFPPRILELQLGLVQGPELRRQSWRQVHGDQAAIASRSEGAAALGDKVVGELGESLPVRRMRVHVVHDAGEARRTRPGPPSVSVAPGLDSRGHFDEHGQPGSHDGPRRSVLRSPRMSRH